MRDLKLRVKIIWALLTNRYTNGRHVNAIWLWTNPQITIVLRGVADSDLAALKKEEE